MDDVRFQELLAREEAQRMLLEELHGGELSGEYKHELVIACEIEIAKIDSELKSGRKIEQKRRDSFQGLRNCFEAAIKYIQANDSVNLPDLQNKALRMEDVVSLGVTIVTDTAAAAEALATEDVGGDSALALSNLHFVHAAEFLGSVFTEVRAIQLGKKDEYLPLLQQEKFRGLPSSNTEPWADYYAKQLYYFHQLTARNSKRAGIVGELVAIAFGALKEGISKQDPKPGEREAQRIIDLAVSGAIERSRLPIQLGKG